MKTTKTKMYFFLSFIAKLIRVCCIITFSGASSQGEMYVPYILYVEINSLHFDSNFS